MVERPIIPVHQNPSGPPPPGETDPPFVTNQVPAPGSTGIATSSAITFRVDDLGDGVDGASIIIEVNQGAGLVEVYNGNSGGLQNGWTGSVTPGGTSGFDFSLADPSGTLADLQTVTVRVRASDLSPLRNSIDVSYSFTTADNAPPFLTAQNPAPSATGVAQSSNIVVRVDDAASPVDLATVNITVTQGAGTPVAAVVAGVIQAPFAGAGSGVSSGGNGHTFTLAPTSALIELGLVTVAVVADDGVGNTLSGLPGVYSFTTADGVPPYLANQSPAAAGTMAATANIGLSIRDDGSGVAQASIIVTLDTGSGPVTVYTGSAFQAGFTGAQSAITPDGMGGFDMVIDPNAALATGSADLRVRADDVGGNSLDTTYTFTVTAAGVVALTTGPAYANEGGAIVEGTVSGLPDGTYRVHVGPLGTVNDPQAYSAVPGQGNDIIVQGGLGEFRLALPPNPSGGPYGLLFIDQNSAFTLLGAAAVTIVNQTFADRRYRLRRQLPNDYAKGVGKLRLEDYPQP